ncbi:L-arabinose isomerase [uncultured Georgenia sp.]|uniref:L-arabinose isomerase n=1 Tax=uncultured Georgenia sp. TaxID=378209 RepID=UPI00261B4660|nr:L-arabinose isomerase [uncultured Georgenia sp.]HLV04817.1 L-arabinose isomerase [Actinomycetaceae bacterium]
MNNPFEGKEIWFLTGSQDLYGEETLAQVAQQSAQIVAQLDGAEEIPVRVVHKGTMKDRDAIRRAALEANSDPRCLGVIVWMHTFSPAKMWILGLEALTKPMLHLHTQANVALPWATIDMDFMNLNQAAHGDREFAYIASRMGVARKTVVGHASTPDVRAKIGTWARAAAGWHALQNMRVCRFGDNMRNVAVTEGDKTEAEIALGVSVNTWAVNDLVERVEAVSDADVDALVAEYDELYDVVPELGPDGARRESLRYGARQELAMRSFLEEGGFTAFTTNFEDLGGLRQLPGLAVQRLMAAGYGFGAEGDWKTAVLVRVAKVMGHGLPGGASLMEDYTYEMTPGREKILGAHMLEVCPSLTVDKPSLEIHPLGIGNREDPVRLKFTADPGPAVLVSLTDLRERFRLTANVVRVVEPDEPLPNLPVACAVWEPEPSFATSAECWLTAGGAHHTAMTTALGIDVWEDLATIAGVELAVIDRETTTRSFAESLRLGQVYYRLAQGF